MGTNYYSFYGKTYGNYNRTIEFFKWAIEYKVIDYIEENYQQIENDMNSRNTSSKKEILWKMEKIQKHAKKEELSVSAVKCIKKEKVKIVVKFDL